MMSFYEAECKRQKDKEHNQDSAVSLGDGSEITVTLQRLMDCVKHNLSGDILYTQHITTHNANWYNTFMCYTRRMYSAMLLSVVFECNVLEYSP